MLRKLVGVLAVMVLVFAVAALYVTAAEMGERESRVEKATEQPAAPAAPAATAAPAAPAAEPSATRTPEEILSRSEERLKQGNASEGLIMRNRQMQAAKFAVDQPAGLVALKDQLKLTADQVKKIEDINAKACAEAKAVLTAEQVAAIGKMKDTPDSPVALSAQLWGSMRGRRGEGGGGGGGGR